MVSCSIIELVHMYRNGQIATREINQLRVRSIKNYLLDNALTKNIYLPPLVASSGEGAAPNGDPIELSIIDGTQRIAAFAQLEDSILKALKKGEEKVKLAYELDSLMKDSSIAIKYLKELTRAEESQLYLDLNLKGKKVALSKRISFDSRNNLNVITNQVLHTHQSLKTAGVELEKRSINRPANKNLLSLSQLRQVIGIFMTGKAHVNIEEKYHKVRFRTVNTSHSFISILMNYSTYTRQDRWVITQNACLPVTRFSLPLPFMSMTKWKTSQSNKDNS